MNALKGYSFVSVAIIAICTAVAVLSNLGASPDALQSLFIANPEHEGLQDVFSGQIWRLLTPVFIHFGLMHFAFNMIWVWDLGGFVEAKKGAGFYIGFALITGVFSNLAQYLFTHSPLFGGMSGVVYGLFGYVWIRGRFDRRFHGLHKTTVIMMLAWFALCWTGLLGPIANWAHTFGLLIGAAWGLLESKFFAPAPSGPEEMAASEGRLEYLSTADMLRIDAQRRWVREHYQADAQHKYDTVDGKLSIIEAILSQKQTQLPTAEEMQSLEIAFGDALAQETGLRWLSFDDGRTRMPMLATQSEPVTVLPLNLISHLFYEQKSIEVKPLFHRTVQAIANNRHGAGTFDS